MGSCQKTKRGEMPHEMSKGELPKDNMKAGHSQDV